jgi:hypothetical protein
MVQYNEETRRLAEANKKLEEIDESIAEKEAAAAQSS